MLRAFPRILAAIALAFMFAIVAFAPGRTSRVAEAVPVVTLAGPGVGNCGIPTTITATVTDGALPVVGTAVTFLSGQGAFAPNPALTNAIGVATTLFTPAISSGVASISATVPGGFTAGATSFAVYCANLGSAYCDPVYLGTCVGYYGSGCTAAYPYTGSLYPYTSTLYPYGSATYPYTSMLYPYASALYPSTCAPYACTQYLGGTCVNTTTAVNAPVAPTTISVLAPSSATCGGALAITATVRDAYGLFVPNGTTVSFSTTLGQISVTDQTIGGVAVSSLTISPKTSGTAQVTVTAGSAIGTASIPVSCTAAATAAPAAAPAAVAPAVVAVAPAPAPAAVRPPSTGDGGLLMDAD